MRKTLENIFLYYSFFPNRFNIDCHTFKQKERCSGIWRCFKWVKICISSPGRNKLLVSQEKHNFSWNLIFKKGLVNTEMNQCHSPLSEKCFTLEYLTQKKKRILNSGHIFYIIVVQNFHSILLFNIPKLSWSLLL